MVLLDGTIRFGKCLPCTATRETFSFQRTVPPTIRRSTITRRKMGSAPETLGVGLTWSKLVVLVMNDLFGGTSLLTILLEAQW